MKSVNKTNNNKGFSLVELIVIIAIISIAAGTLALSVSLVVGSEAKKAVQKIEASLDSAKTGAMSRYSETLTIQYLDKDVSDGRDVAGFYAVETIETLKKGSGTTPVDHRTVGKEQRRLCDARVDMVLTYDDGGSSASTTIEKDGSNSFIFEYDRGTGLFKNIGIGDSSGGVTYYGQPISLECTSGLRTYKIKFLPETGKHVRE